MTRPLKVNVGTSPVSLKEMTNTELAYVGNKIAAPVAASLTGTLTGELNINGATGVVIGEFVDTYRAQPVGTHPVGTTVSSTTYQIKQVQTVVSENAYKKPLGYNPSLYGLQELEVKAGNALYDAIMDGIQYKIQLAQPTEPGTWVNLGTIQDTRVGATAGSQTLISEAYLWKRTSLTLTEPTTNYRPFHLSSGILKEITDAELAEMLPTAQNDMITSGIGQYSFQETAPLTGTWVQMGTGLANTVQDTSDLSYTGTYTSNYTGTYSQNYTGFYTGTYGTAYTGFYTGYYSQAYAGAYAGVYNQAYAQAFAGSYATYYVGFVGAYYTGYYTGYFVQGYTGYYTGYYSSSYAGTYTGYYTQGYTGTYSGTYTGTYTGTYAQAYAGSYTGTTVVGTVTTENTKKLWKRIM